MKISQPSECQSLVNSMLSFFSFGKLKGVNWESIVEYMAKRFARFISLRHCRSAGDSSGQSSKFRWRDVRREMVVDERMVERR